MDGLIQGVMKSQGYKNLKVSKNTSRVSPLKKVASFASPAKSPCKENSPLKKMSSLRKQSRLAEQENANDSPLKVFGKVSGSPEKNMLSGKLLQKNVTSDEKNMLRSFGESS